MTVCPVCASHGPFSPLPSPVWPLARCIECSHTWAPDAVPVNTLMESDHYSVWREEQQARLESVARERVGWFRRRTDRRGAVLEIGCSTGETLAAWQAQGWDGYGLDLSSAAIRVGQQRYRSLKLATGIDLQSFGRQFDLVAGFHVVEHMREIATFAAAARTTLAPQGMVYFRVPHWNSAARRVTGQWWPDFVPEHLHFFSRASMQRWLEGAGFRIVAMETVGQIWPWLSGLRRAITRRRPTTSATHALPSRRVMALLSLLERVASPVLKIEGLLGWGHELAVIAQRVDTPT